MKDEKNIVIMYDFFSELGGLERIMLFQAKTLKRLGFLVTFAFAYVNEELANEYFSGFKVIEYGKFFIKNETIQICSSIFRKKNIVFFKDASLIICHSFPASYLAVRIKQEYGIPFILHLHHPPQFLYNTNIQWALNSFKRFFAYLIAKIAKPLLKKFDRYCIEKADGYILEGKAVQKVINETYSNIIGSIIYPTVNEKFHLTEPDKNDLKEYGINGDYILCSGRIVRQKCFDYAIEAFSRLNNYNSLQLIISGQYEHKEKKRLEKICQKKKLKNVYFLGQVPFNNLVSFYSYACVTLLTCPKEWFGLVSIEAMSCGSPVVAWKDNFGPEETVIPELNGYLAKPYDIDDFARNIEACLAKEWDKTQIIASVNRFSEKNMMDRLIQVVANITGDYSVINHKKSQVNNVL